MEEDNWGMPLSSPADSFEVKIFAWGGRVQIFVGLKKLSSARWGDICSKSKNFQKLF